MASSMPPCEMVAFKDHVTVTLRPEIVQSSWSDIESFGGDVRTELESRRSPACVVDLSPLTYMGSAIVALIVRVWKVVQAQDGKMVVVCKHPGVREVIELAGLDKIWTIAPELSVAQKKLGVKKPVDPPVAVAPAGTHDSSPPVNLQPVPLHSESIASPRSSSAWYFALGALTVLAAVVAVLAAVLFNASRQ